MTAVVSKQEAAVLRRQHKEKLAIYHRLLRGQSVPFFDVVVITSGDAEQTATYEALVAELLAAGRLPRQPKYIVVPDPPGRRVGCGGATFYVLRDLSARFPGRLGSLRVLLIHAGGYSKRLPNHSHCGKIFSLLPVPAPADARAAMTMLELKLATFAHVAAQMPPPGSGPTCGGVVTTCSDDLIFYDHSVCDFTKPGFTAFGHPSPVTIGKDHGVFVLSEVTRQAGAQLCRKFLHKPPIDLQRSERAVVGTTGDGQDEVYTDSSFYFSGDVALAMLEMFEGPLGGKVEAEVDAYGDFMHPLGPEATRAYQTNFGNTAKDDDAERAALLAVRETLYKTLSPHPLHCLALPGSRFFHVGTVGEALHHFAEDDGFLTAVGAGAEGAESHLPAGGVCIIESAIDAAAALDGQPRGTVVEYSRVAAGCRVGHGCLLSGVELPEGTDVPPETFVQTLPVRAAALPAAAQAAAAAAGLGAGTLYVTHILGSRDDIKKAHKGGLLSRCVFPIFGDSDAARHLPLDGKSLWTAALFPLCASPRASLDAALATRATLRGGAAPACWAEGGRGLLVSLADCVVAKDLPTQQRQRRALLADLHAAAPAAGCACAAL